MPIAYTTGSADWHVHHAAAGVPDARLHDARHAAATLLLESGVDAHVIAAILGHSDVVTTRGYEDMNLELWRKALEGLGKSIGPTRRR